MDKDTEGSNCTRRRHPSCSFVDSIMVALTAEEKEDRNASPSELTGTAVHPEYDSDWTVYSDTSNTVSVLVQVFGNVNLVVRLEPSQSVKRKTLLLS